MNSRVDSTAMLLSCDWFTPYWQAIGIRVEAAERTLLKKGCREIVRQIMSGVAVYWNTDFSRERVEKTASMFRELFERYSLTVETRDAFKSLISEDLATGAFADESTRWLLVTMTEQLLREADLGDVDAAATKVLAEAFSPSADQCEKTDFRELSLTSGSEWDAYIRSTTPDLPTYLADHVSAVRSEEAFRRLWHLLSSRLTTKQRSQLFKWYRARGESLTGTPLRLAYEN